MLERAAGRWIRPSRVSARPTLAASFGSLRQIGVQRGPRAMPRFVATTLAIATGALDKIGLSRPPWTPEVWRAAGWYAFLDATKARTELDWNPRPFHETVRRASGC